MRYSSVSEDGLQGFMVFKMDYRVSWYLRCLDLILYSLKPQLESKVSTVSTVFNIENIFF